MNTTSLNPELRVNLSASTVDVTQGVTMPPLVYFDPEFYAFELDAIFGHEWLCLGRLSWIREKGDYFTTSFAGEPLVVVRTGPDPMDFKCLSTVCRHKGMLVAEGKGNCRLFRCPYHHWVYGLDGVLAGAPAMEKTIDFERRDIALPSIRTEVWQGFIFCNFDEEAEPLGPRLTKLEPDLQHYGIAGTRGPEPKRFPDFPWNWKVHYENSNDGYHANRLHKGPLHDVCPSNLASWGPWDDGDVAYIRYNGLTHIDGGLGSPTGTALLPIFPELTETERQRVLFVNIPPTLGVICTPDAILYTIIHPEGPERTSTQVGRLYSEAALRDPGFEHKTSTYSALTQVIQDQDRYVDTLQQVGLRSRFAPRGQLSWQDQSSVNLARWLVRRYLERWPAPDEDEENSPSKI